MLTGTLAEALQPDHVANAASDCPSQQVVHFWHLLHAQLIPFLVVDDVMRQLHLFELIEFLELPGEHLLYPALFGGFIWSDGVLCV